MEKTIAAISTPPYAAGLGVVRLSGEAALPIAERVFRAFSVGKKLSAQPGYTCLLGRVWDEHGDVDEAVATVFRAPKSYTGEDVVEFSCHGGPELLRRALRAVLAAGAAPAGPGEFTKRAFLNGKLTLTQAEAVMDLIASRSEQAGRAALAMRDGALFAGIRAVSAELLTLQGHFAAWVDYPEEDVPALSPGEMDAVLARAGEELGRLIAGYDSGRVLREGAAAVLAGKPNVGKSTLMNLLAGCRRSIVTEIPGTTRDVVEELVMVEEIPLRLLDTAGLRDTDDPVERIGVEMAEEELSRCDVALAVFDGSTPLDAEDRRLLRRLRGRPAVAIVNKADLGSRADLDAIAAEIPEVVRFSAVKGEGLPEFTEALRRVLRLRDFDPSQAMMANERQLACAREAAGALAEAREALGAGMTLDAVNVCVQAALEALSTLTGENASEAVIEEVFSRFCVGK